VPPKEMRPSQPITSTTPLPVASLVARDREFGTDAHMEIAGILDEVNPSAPLVGCRGFEGLVLVPCPGVHPWEMVSIRRGMARAARLSYARCRRQSVLPVPATNRPRCDGRSNLQMRIGFTEEIQMKTHTLFIAGLVTLAGCGNAATDACNDYVVAVDDCYLEYGEENPIPLVDNFCDAYTEDSQVDYLECLTAAYSDGDCSTAEGLTAISTELGNCVEPDPEE